jgi:uncharacterized membrane protein (UPF0136 family)
MFAFGGKADIASKLLTRDKARRITAAVADSNVLLSGIAGSTSKSSRRFPPSRSSGFT